MWQIGLGTAVGALVLANPVNAATSATAMPQTSGNGWVLLVAGLVVAVALSRRPREARVIC